MDIISTITEARNIIKNVKKNSKTVGFVPTMGYLHEGHLSLLRRAKAENDFVVLSIFINPTQFGNNEDLDKYPRDIERDKALALEAKTDLIFTPTSHEMYPGGYSTYVDVEGITQGLCGASRPGHFKGVTTIVTKLFNIVAPDKAYFGQKDAQQASVIERMTKELDMDIKIVVCPIVRETDGLAMSSRNVYLSLDERRAALVLSKSLEAAREKVGNGEINVQDIKKMIIENISKEPLACIDYVEIVDYNTFKKAHTIKDKTLIALAVKFGKTRLIDNIVISPKVVLRLSGMKS